MYDVLNILNVPFPFLTLQVHNYELYCKKHRAILKLLSTGNPQRQTLLSQRACHPTDHKIPAIREFCDIIHNHPLEKPEERKKTY
jgi:hypothetical protein